MRKWNSPACCASQPYALAGPMSSSVPSRCSEWPGGATHLGSGCAAKSLACSSSLRNAEVMTRSTPSARAAAYMRSNASATSGRIGLPCRRANGPVYSPSPSESTGSMFGGTSSASATCSDRTAERAAPTATRTASSTATRMRTGAIGSASGKETVTARAPFALAVRSAASRPSAR